MLSQIRRTLVSMRRAASLAAMIALLGGPSWADVQDPEVINPDKAVQALIAENIQAIRMQTAVALDEKADTEKRLDGVDFISGVYFDYLLANSKELIKTENPAVALKTTTAIGGQISMLPSHEGMQHGDSPLSSYDSYLNGIVSKSISTLRLALDHDSAAVRSQAASLLASRGDAPSLARIQVLIDEGRMPGKVGIGYLSLAPTGLASAFVEKYVESADLAVRAAAVGQLSYNTDYTSRVREIALQPDSPDSVIIAALPGLAVTDDEFLTYGAALAQNTDLAASVREQALESTVKFSIARGTPLSTINTIAPMLQDASEDLNSQRARDAYEELRSQYQLPQ